MSNPNITTPMTVIAAGMPMLIIKKPNPFTRHALMCMPVHYDRNCVYLTSR